MYGEQLAFAGAALLVRAIVQAAWEAEAEAITKSGQKTGSPARTFSPIR